MACAGGWALDAMDVQLYSFVIPTLIAIWGITRAQAGELGTAALLVSAVGGWLAGWLADRYGRVRTLQVAILWFAVFTFLSGLAQNFEQLFAARALMGLGFGGEWAAGAVLLGEVIRPEHRGKALGMMQAGWAVGWGTAALLYAFFFSVLPAETAWRALFLVGIAPALLVFFVRRYVEEPAVYLETRSKLAAQGDRPSALEIFRPPLLRVTVLGGLMGTGAQGGYYAVTTWLPTFLRTERKLSVLDSAGYLAVSIVGAFCGYLAGGYLADKIGRRLTFLVFAIGAGVVAVTYTMVPFGDRGDAGAGIPAGLLRVGRVQRDGSVLHRAFSDARARRRPGVRVQPRAGDGRAVSDAGGASYRRGFRWARRSDSSPASRMQRWLLRHFCCPKRGGKSSRLKT